MSLVYFFVMSLVDCQLSLDVIDSLVFTANYTQGQLTVDQ